MAMKENKKATNLGEAPPSQVDVIITPATTKHHGLEVWDHTKST